MGHSFGAGIGMAFGRAKVQARGGHVVVIAGDGAFFMHGMEVHTAVQYRLPVTFVLLNNNAHAMCVTREQLFYGDLYSYNRFAPSRLGAGLAAMLPGLASVDVTDVDGFSAAMRTALDVDGRQSSASNARLTKSRAFATFLEPSVAKNVVCQYSRGEQNRCRPQRLTILSSIPRVCTTSNTTGPTYGRRVCARGPQRAVVLTRYVLDREVGWYWITAHFRPRAHS